MCRGNESGEDHHHRHQGGKDRPIDPAIGQHTADDIAGDHSQTEQRQHDRHQALRHSGHIGQGGGDVGVHREHATEADGSDQQGQQDLWTTQCREFGTRVGHSHTVQIGYEPRDRDDRREPDDGDNHVGIAPAESLAQPGGRGHADHIGRAQAQHHRGDRLRPLPYRCERGRCQRSDTEVGAMWQSGDETRRNECGEDRCDHRGDTADRERDHQGNEQALARHAGAQGRDHRRADDHSQRVGRYGVTGGGLRYSEIGRNIG